jgi:hypothetical protein
MFVELLEEECKVMISSCQIVDIATVSLRAISIQKNFSHYLKGSEKWFSTTELQEREKRSEVIRCVVSY